MKSIISILTILVLTMPAFVQAQHDHNSESDSNFQEEFTTLIESYLSIKDHLVESDKSKALEAAEGMAGLLEQIGEHRLEGDDHMAWMNVYNSISNSMNSIQNSTELDKIREHFQPLSEELAGAAEHFDVEGVVYVQYCPMAFNNNGGSWLSREEQIVNPYLPDTMLGCGRVIDRIES